MKKKLYGKCPCGYVFGTFYDEEEAIAAVRLHFERLHTDFLPFGISDEEALSLLIEVRTTGKQKVTPNEISKFKLSIVR